MSVKKYDWENGAELADHTRKKHEILRRYFHEYLLTRCKIPRQEKFRLAVVDGFAGAGIYRCGSYGSPLIFVDGLLKASAEINFYRQAQGMKPLVIECLLLFNDSDRKVIKQLEQNLAPILVQVAESQHLHIETVYYSNTFEAAYPDIKQRLLSARCRNVFFNLDQCGYSHAPTKTLRDILSSWHSAEVLLTFMIQSFLTFLSPDSNVNGIPLESGMKDGIQSLLAGQEGMMGKKEWLAEAEKVVYACLKDCATYVSPFAIHNPTGWQYWLMHFATSYRARQVYNDVLHQCDAQAHFGGSGLRMLSYNPANEGQLYLFDSTSRQASKEALYEDIPRFVAESGDAISVHDFYAAAYSETPAHSEDINEMIILNEDVEVITESGGLRRRGKTIRPTDTLKMKSQRSLFIMFPK